MVDDDEVNAVEEKRVRRRSKSAHEKSEKDEPSTMLKKKPRIHVEVIILINIKLCFFQSCKYSYIFTCRYPCYSDNISLV